MSQWWWSLSQVRWDSFSPARRQPRSTGSDDAEHVVVIAPMTGRVLRAAARRDGNWPPGGMVIRHRITPIGLTTAGRLAVRHSLGLFAAVGARHCLPNGAQAELRVRPSSSTEARAKGRTPPSTGSFAGCDEQRAEGHDDGERRADGQVAAVAELLNPQPVVIPESRSSLRVMRGLAASAGDGRQVTLSPSEGSDTRMSSARASTEARSNPSDQPWT